MFNPFAFGRAAALAAASCVSACFGVIALSLMFAYSSEAANAPVGPEFPRPPSPAVSKIRRCTRLLLSSLCGFRPAQGFPPGSVASRAAAQWHLLEKFWQPEFQRLFGRDLPPVFLRLCSARQLPQRLQPFTSHGGFECVAFYEPHGDVWIDPSSLSHFHHQLGLLPAPHTDAVTTYALLFGVLSHEFAHHVQQQAGLLPVRTEYAADWRLRMRRIEEQAEALSGFFVHRMMVDGVLNDSDLIAIQGALVTYESIEPHKRRSLRKLEAKDSNRLKNFIIGYNSATLAAIFARFDFPLLTDPKTGLPFSVFAEDLQP